MILQLLTTSLLLVQGTTSFNLAYKQHDDISTNNYNYEIEQELYITDKDNLYISFTLWNDDREWFKVESERPLADYMPWLTDENFYEFPKELYALPVAWFGVDNGNLLYESYDLLFTLNQSENILSTLAIGPYDYGNMDVYIDYLYSFGITYDYISDYLFTYYNYNLYDTIFNEYVDYAEIILHQDQYWNYSYSTDEIPDFGDLVIDLSITYGHIQTLYDMKYNSNGLSSQINGLLNNSYNNGYNQGYNQGLDDGYNIRNDLYLPFKNAIIVGAYRDENGEITFVDRYNLELVNGIYDFSSVVADIEDISNDEPDYNSSEDAYINIELESGVRASDIIFDIIGFEDLVFTYSDGTQKYYNNLSPLKYTSIEDDANKNISSIELTFNLFDNLQDYKLGIQVRDSYSNGFDNGFSEGQQSVIKQPNSFGLYDEQQFKDNYQKGYNQGAFECEINPLANVFVIFENAASSVGALLSIPIMPGITLGTLIGVFVGIPLLILLLKHLGK